MPESRTQQFRGRSPADRPDWEVSTVARRTTNSEGSRPCAVTGQSVALNKPHFYVTLRTGSSGAFRNYDYDHLVVADGALGELDEWLKDGDE